MRLSNRRPASLAVVGAALALLVGACAGSATSPTISPGASATPATSASQAAGPSLTPVPGGASMTPATPQPSLTTTDTAWGTIVDSLPGDFPVYPGATATEAVGGPASGAWTIQATAKTVGTWYQQALAAAGYSSNDLSGPLEDGSYTVDTQSDLPECRVQTTARPQGDLTLITVLFGAGCVGLGG